VKNGSETGVDCGGGGVCAKCANGQGCLVNTDCLSNNCAGGTCQPPGPVCGDGVIGAGEQCDDSNTTANDGCSPTCQCEVSVIKTVGPGLNVSVPDDTYNGTIASMACVNVAIPAVAGCGTTVTSVVVAEGMSHTWVGDLVLKLIAPDNTTVTLMSRPGLAETADDGTGCCGFASDLVAASPVTFQMGAGTSAENMGSAGVVVCQGDGICTYAPNAGAALPGTLNTFIGHTAAGTWKFCAGDGGTGDVGTIDRVTLTIGK
jgi:cysteine-rich repeat protein